MDKHNKHHKNKAKGAKQPQSSQLGIAVALDPTVDKTDTPAVSGQKSKSSKSKGKGK
jgi:hypothetical protein